MKTAYLFLASLFLTSCATTGKDVSLVVDDSDWKYKRLSGQESFVYQCGSGVSIETPKIMVQHETHWAGPIIPIVPVFSSTNHTESNLLFRLVVGGAVGGIRPQLESLEFLLLTGADTYKGKTEFHAQETWASINVEFPVVKSQLSEFVISFSQPIPGCGLSKIHYVKRESENNEFTLSPGN